MNWLAANTYAAKIGGIIYRNVRCPILLDGQCVFKFARSSTDGQLAVTFDLHQEDTRRMASVTNNVITGFDPSIYILLEDTGRSALIERKTGRVWCEISVPRRQSQYELDISCVLISSSAYPLLLHPNRSKFGAANDGKAPNISRLTLTTDVGSKASAVCWNRAPLYMLSVAIENFDVGINVVFEGGR